MLHFCTNHTDSTEYLRACNSDAYASLYREPNALLRCASKNPTHSTTFNGLVCVREGGGGGGGGGSARCMQLGYTAAVSGNPWCFYT